MFQDIIAPEKKFRLILMNTRQKHKAEVTIAILGKNGNHDFGEAGFKFSQRSAQ